MAKTFDEIACDMAEEFGKSLPYSRFRGTTVENATVAVKSAEMIELIEKALRYGYGLATDDYVKEG